jgi:hypothetical protein
LGGELCSPPLSFSLEVLSMNGTDGITFIFARNLVDAINKVGEGHALFASRFYLLNERLTFYEEDLLRGDFSDKDYIEKRGRTASLHFLLRALGLGDKEKERLFDSVVFEDKEKKIVSIQYYDIEFSYPHICVFSSSSFVYTLDLVVRDVLGLNSISQDFKSQALEYILGFKEILKGDIVSFSSVISSSEGYERNSSHQYEYLSDVFLNKLKNIFDLLLTGSPERVYSFIDKILKHYINFYENIASSLMVALDNQKAYDHKEEPVFYFRRVEEPLCQDKSPLFLESYYMEGGKVHLWAVPTYLQLTPEELKEGYFYLSLDIEKLPFSGKFVIIPLYLSTEDGNFVLLFPFKVMRIDNNLGEAYEFGSSIPLSSEIERKIGYLGRYINTCSFRRPRGDESKEENGKLSLFLDYSIHVFLSYDFDKDLRSKGFYDLSATLYLDTNDFVIDATVGQSWNEVYINGFRSREGKCQISLPKFVVNGKKAFKSRPDKEETRISCNIARRYLKEVLDVFEEDFMERGGLEPALIVRSVYDGGLGSILGDQGFSNEKRWDRKYALDLAYFSVRALIDSVRTVVENDEIFYKSCYYNNINLFGDQNKRYFSVSKVSLNFDSDISVTTDLSYLIKAVEEFKSVDKKVLDVDTSLCFDSGEGRLNIPVYSLSGSFRERYLRNLLQSSFEINKMKILLSLGFLGEEMREEKDKAKVAIASLFLNGIPSDQRLFDALMSTNLEGIVSILDYFGKIIDFQSIGKGVDFNLYSEYTLFLDIRKKIDEGKENSTLSTLIVEFRFLEVQENFKILPMIINAVEVREGEFVTMAYLSSFQELVEKPPSRF